MSVLSPILGILDRRGERVWFRNISRDVNYSTGEPRENYADNKSCTCRIVEDKITERGISIFLPVGKAVLYGKPSELFNDSIQVKVNDVIIRNPSNYSVGTSTIYRVSSVRRMPLANQSNFYIRLGLGLTAAKE